MSDVETNVIDMEKKVTIISIAPWSTGFPHYTTSGSTNIVANGTTRLKREEVIAQIQANNRLFGLDDIGSHATLYIDDEETRKYLGFDEGNRKQNVISEDKIKEWFALKTFSTFKKKIEENVITRAEKQFLLKKIKDLKLNEYDKIKFCKEYCKFKLR